MGLLYTPRNRGQVLSAQYDKEYARISIDRMPSELWGHRPVLPTIYLCSGFADFVSLLSDWQSPFADFGELYLQISVIDLQFSVIDLQISVT
jgi:hypothetical protein